MKALSTTCISLLLLLGAGHSHAAIEMLDRIVAIVDQNTVTQSELDKRLEEIKVRSQSTGVSLPPLSKLREQILDQLILETLQLNMAKRFGVNTPDEDVFKYVQNLLAQRRMTEQQLLVGLQQEGITLNEFKENVRKQLTLQTIAQGVVSSRIKISDLDVENFINSAEAQFWVSPDFRLQHILIPIPSGANTSEVQKAQDKASDVYRRLKNGADFAAMAVAESRGPSALKGGDLGFRKSSELPSLFAEIAPTLQINDIAKPARSQAGFHILKLLEKRGDNTQIVTQNKVRHILIETSEILNKEEALKKIQGIRADIIEGSEFSAMAKRYSNDIGSKLSGGDLGWSNPGAFVAEFENTMNTIKLNDISEPFFTQFGWHILQVLERREEDLSDDVVRNRARNILIGRRFEDEVQVWLQELRDNAFIEIKI